MRESVRVFLHRSLETSIDNDENFLSWLSEALETSQKFLLPEYGKLIEDVDVIKNADLLRLPYFEETFASGIHNSDLRFIRQAVAWLQRGGKVKGSVCATLQRQFI